MLDSAITARHVPLRLPLLRNLYSAVPPSTKSIAGKPRPQATSLGVEEKVLATQADKMGSMLLDRSHSSVVGMEEFTNGGCSAD
jgi:hypothetical protein